MSEDFERALDRVAAGHSPLDELASLSPEERQMVRMAQLLRGSTGQAMRPGFSSELHGRLSASSGRVSRRAAFMTAIGTLAAGILAGLGLDRFVNRSTPSDTASPPVIEMKNGRWMPVATVAELPDGAIRSFKAGAVQGFVMKRGGELRAVSRICTHMPCALNFEQQDQTLVCPCHGAEFNLQGRHIPDVNYGYTKPLPPLPRVKVRSNGDQIEVWSA